MGPSYHESQCASGVSIAQRGSGKVPSREHFLRQVRKRASQLKYSRKKRNKYHMAR